MIFSFRRPALAALALLLAVWIGSPESALAHHREALTVRLLNLDGTEFASFPVPNANPLGGATIEAADLGDDGVPELIIGNSIGNEPRVHVLRLDGSEIGSFLAYAPEMGVGITVAICDTNGDGTQEIVTGTQYGGGPQVRVFTNMGEAIHPGFFAYAEGFRGGVNVGCIDWDADGDGEIITTPGPSGGPHVRIWDEADSEWAVTEEFFAFDASDRGGLMLWSNQDTNEWVLGSMLGTTNTVLHLTAGETVPTGTSDLPLEYRGLSALELIDGNIWYAGAGDNFLTRFDTLTNIPVVVDSINIAFTSTDTNGDGVEELIVANGRPTNGPEGTKHILVDISEQQLYAYENRMLANTFPISSGKYPYRTPVGNHTVLAKLPYVYYAGVELDGTPWDLGNVPYNLRFFPRHYIHYAYWHNNFGHQMSHGCVNVGLENMKWIYGWATEGIAVEVRE